MPETTVAAVSEDGDTIDRPDGHPSQRRELERLEELPDSVAADLDETKAPIVLAALNHPHLPYSEVRDILNDHRSDAGLDPIEYHHVYRTVSDVLDIQTEPKTTDMSDSTTKTYDDLTKKQRAVINEFIRDPDQSPTEIAERAGVDPSYPKQVIEKYGHIADEMTNADVVPVDDGDGDDPSSESTAPEDTLTDADDGEDEDTTATGIAVDPASVEGFDDLTSLQQDVIQQLAAYPDRSHSQIANEVGCDSTYPQKLEDNFSHIIHALRGEAPSAEAEVESESRPSDPDTGEAGADAVDGESRDEVDSEPAPRSEADAEAVADDSESAEMREITISGTDYRVPAGLAEQYTERTEKQQSVIDELVHEDDPTNPDRSQSEISENAGVHSTYVGAVQKKYGDIAAAIAETVDLSTAEESEPEHEPETVSDGTEPELDAEDPAGTDDEVAANQGDRPSDAISGLVHSDLGIEEGAVPITVLEQILQQVESMHRTAVSEMGYAEELSAPHGRAAASEEMMRLLTEAIEATKASTQDSNSNPNSDSNSNSENSSTEAHLTPSP